MKRSKKRSECFYCEDEFSVSDLTKDHFIPQALGGGYLPNNIVMACEPCNAGKADRLPTAAEIERFIQARGEYPGGERGRAIIVRYTANPVQPSSLSMMTRFDRFRMRVENEMLMARHRLFTAIEAA